MSLARRRVRCLLLNAKGPARTVSDVYLRYTAAAICVCAKCKRKRAAHKKALAYFKGRPLVKALRRRRGMTDAGSYWLVPVGPS